MRGRRNLLPSVNALRSAPNFDLVTHLGEIVAAPNGGMIADMLAAMQCDFLIPLNDANLVFVHDASPICAMGIAGESDKGASHF